MSKKRNDNKIPGFIPLFGKENKLNSNLIDTTLINEDRFYVKDIYGGIFRIDEKTYKLLRKE